jgi:hypothetical protein
MSILRFSYLRFFRVMALAFFVGLFIDACNIADLFVGRTFEVRHDDPAAAVDLHVASAMPSHVPLSHLQLSVPGATSRIRVLYDEDSPLTEVHHEASFLSAPLVRNESRMQLLYPYIVAELYLRNSTLLI